LSAPNTRTMNEINKYLELQNAPEAERDTMRKMVAIKHKELLLESMAENNRRGNYVRIYPSKNSDLYDAFFSGSRPLNRFLYKAMISDELMPSNKSPEMKLNYVVNFDMPSYDNIKKKIIITEGKEEQDDDVNLSPTPIDVA
jgi:hypothetical protein